MLGKDLKIPLNFKWNLKEVTIEESFDEEISENFFISDYIFSFHTVETLYAWDNFKKYNHHEVFLKDLKELVRRSFEIDEKFAFLSRQFRWVYNRLKEFKKLWDGIKEYRCRTERCSLFLEFMDDDNEREYPGEVPNLNEIRRHEPELYYRLIPLRDALYKLEDKEIYKILGEDPNRWGYYHNSKSWISFPQKLISMKKDLKKIAEKFSDSFDKFIEAQKDFFKDGIISLLKKRQSYYI